MGLFDDTLYGVGGNIPSSVQLSYEEEAYIDSEVTEDPVTLSDYCSECYQAMTSILGAIAVSEGIAADQIHKGQDRVTVMESLKSRAEDAYDTLKRWAHKLWTAIKKFVKKAWTRLKYIGERIKAFFGSYEAQLRGYNGNIKVPWCTMNISAAATAINGEYTNQDLMNRAGLGSLTNVDQVRMNVIASWRDILYPEGSGTGHGDSNHNRKGSREGKAATYKQVDFQKVKPEILRTTTMGFDKYERDFLNWGEKDFREAISLDKDEISDRRDSYDDIEKEELPDSAKYPNVSPDERDRVYHQFRDDARMRIKLSQCKLQLRQRGIQMLHAACTRYYNQCLKAARMALKDKAGVRPVGDSTTYGLDIDSYSIDAIVNMI